MTDIEAVILNAIGDTLDEVSMSQVMLAHRAVCDALNEAGYVVVPREPTVAMDEAPMKFMPGVGSFTAAETWRCMISAWEREQTDE